MKKEQAEILVDWLIDTATATDYGEISITVTRHAGQTRTIERAVSIKERSLEDDSPQQKGPRRYGS